MRKRPVIRAFPTLDGLAIPLQQLDRTHVLLRGRKLVYLAGCDYFRLASHPAILDAIRTGLDRYGLNVAASRRTTGNHAIYEKLESTAANHFDAESATLVSSGYLANLCAAQALSGDFTHALLDERAHGSLRNAAQLLGCPILPFRHRDAADVRRAAARCGRRARILLMTEGLQAHSGEVAPLADYLEALPSSGRMLVDDAHGVGVLGRHGRGTGEHLGLGRNRIIQTITLSKAFGVYGGMILGPRALRKRIIDHSPIFVGNTPLPLPLAVGALTALDLVRAQPVLRRRLIFNTAYVKAALREAGLPVNDGPGPIIPIHPRSGPQAQRLCRALLRAGFHPPLIRYQAGPGAAYFRFALSSEHDAAQLELMARTLARTWSCPPTRQVRRAAKR